MTGQADLPAITVSLGATNRAWRTFLDSVEATLTAAG